MRRPGTPPRPPASTHASDQTLGAGILWIGGDLVGLPFILIVVNRMSREDTRKAAVIDAELDAADEAGPTRLWWEDDPQLAERFRRQGS